MLFTQYFFIKEQEPILFKEYAMDKVKFLMWNQKRFLNSHKLTYVLVLIWKSKRHNPVNSLYKWSASLNFFSQFHKAEISVGRRVELDWKVADKRRSHLGKNQSLS